MTKNKETWQNRHPRHKHSDTSFRPLTGLQAQDQIDLDKWYVISTKTGSEYWAVKGDELRETGLLMTSPYFHEVNESLFMKWDCIDELGRGNYMPFRGGTPNFIVRIEGDNIPRCGTAYTFGYPSGDNRYPVNSKKNLWFNVDTTYGRISHFYDLSLPCCPDSSQDFKMVHDDPQWPVRTIIHDDPFAVISEPEPEPRLTPETIDNWQSGTVYTPKPKPTIENSELMQMAGRISEFFAGYGVAISPDQVNVRHVAEMCYALGVQPKFELVKIDG